MTTVIFQPVPELKLGKGAAVPTGLPCLSSYRLVPEPTPPAHIAPPAMGSLTMAVNDQLGCCTISAVTHKDQCDAAVAGVPYAYPGDPEVKSTYLGLTGGADNGLVEALVLRTWFTEGLFGKKCGLYVPVTPKHLNMVKLCTFLTGSAYTGILVTAKNQYDFQHGIVWDYTGDPADSDFIGGHAVPIVGYNAIGPIIYTWGGLQQTTWRWWVHAAEECYAVLSPEDLAAGKLNGFDVPRILADLHGLN
jgi:hypothetical protein